MTIEKSKLAVNFPHIPNISGVEIFTCCTGMRYKKEDLFIAYFPKLANAAGVFTKSSMYGDPIAWCKSILDQHEAKILAVNSGYANVFCGEVGKKTIENTVAKLTEKFSCNPNQIYISSTGVIGEPVKDEFLLDAIDNKLEESSWLKATEAIGTTDTFPKGAYIESQINGVKVKLAGIIKGSGMVAPDMATMLSFIFTDAKISKQVLQELLEESIAGSYHSITVDSDTSTSDMVLAFATNHAENKVVEDINDPDFKQFRADFHELNKSLAKLVIRDGEGVTKFTKIIVNGAKNDDSARKIALSIANSPLVKTAIAGEDPNWGRVIMAVGKSGEKADRNKVKLYIGDILTAENGGLSNNYSEDKASEYMKGDEITFTIDVAVGEGSAEVFTSDLTHQYISINADYRS